MIAGPQRPLFDPDTGSPTHTDTETDTETVVGPGLALTCERGRFAALDLDVLGAAIPWRQEHLFLHGRRVPVPRLSAWIADPGLDYTYSGLRHAPEPWPEVLERVRRECSQAAGVAFDAVLCNRYRDGADSVAWHADDEPELGPAPVIASVSVGAPRRFVLRRIDDPAERRELVLGHGDLVLMRPPTQRYWHHQIPKTAKPVGERINLTFRCLRGRAGPRDR